jgi:hypothetical protein
VKSASTRQPAVVIHPGMHKTGTTFLQWNVFHFVDANYLWHIFYKSWLKDVLNPKKKPDYKKIKKKFSRILSRDKVNIISEENIYTYQFSKKDDRFIRLERIKKIFPEAKIIFGIRDKEENLASWYVEYVAVGGVLDFEGFLEKHMNVDKLDYEPYIKKLQKYYGKENVFVYSMDDLRRDQDGLIKNICKFIDVDPPEKYRKKPARVGYGLRALKLSLFLNRFFKTPVNRNGIIPCWGPALPQNIIFHSFIVKLFPKKKIKLDDLNSLAVPVMPRLRPKPVMKPVITRPPKKELPMLTVKGMI